MGEERLSGHGGGVVANASRLGQGLLQRGMDGVQKPHMLLVCGRSHGDQVISVATSEPMLK